MPKPLLIKMLAVLIITLLFMFLYMALPNTKVNYKKAFIAAFIAAVLFQILSWSYVNFQIGASRINAIYGGFAALPLFLVWVQYSWYVVLFGAELAFSYENVDHYELEEDIQNLSIRYKKGIALTFCIPKELELLEAIEKYTNQNIPIGEIDADVEFTDELLNWEIDNPHQKELNAALPKEVSKGAFHQKAEKNTKINRIIFTGNGKAFVAGADIKFFIDHIKHGKIDEIKKFTEFAQKLFSKIANSKKTTIAYCDGLTLGGGAELALACDYRVGTDRTLIGFPETMASKALARPTTSSDLMVSISCSV